MNAPLSTDPKLDPQFKSKWLEALRSGRYKQRKGALRGNDKFCCLGVALDILDRDAWVPGGWSSPTQDIGNMATFPVAAQIGCSGATCNALAQMNDSGHSFGEIADWIEKNL